MHAYHRLTEGERNQVYALKKAGLTQCAIADQICVNKSTISRELKRNTGLRGYRPKQAHRLACARQSQILRTRISDAMWIGIEKMIREDWSPEQISGHLKDIGEPSVRAEWIYQHILHERGVDICHETVRFWVERFGSKFAREIRKNRAGQHSNWQWHLDEVFVKINSERFYL